MISNTFSYRISYSETDQMGFVHHSNYARLYENARWEMFRQMGIAYSNIESMGIYMPVISMESKFIKPIHYDEEIRIITRIYEMPTAKLKFNYAFYNQTDELIHEAEVCCAFINSASHIACRPPQKLIESLHKQIY